MSLGLSLTRKLSLTPVGERLGPEVITNGGFTGGGAGWSNHAEWSFSGDQAVCNAVGGAGLFQFGPLTAATTYRVSLDVTSFTSGAFTIRLGTVVLSPTTASAGNHVLTGTSDGTDLTIAADGGIGLVASIDNVSVRAVL